MVIFITCLSATDKFIEMSVYLELQVRKLSQECEELNHSFLSLPVCEKKGGGRLGG